MARVPDNEISRAMAEVSRLNSMRGGGGPVTAGPSPSVRSAAMNREDVEVPPLAPEEKARLDEEARKLGLLPAQEEAGPYDSFEAAKEAARAPEAAQESLRQRSPEPPQQRVQSFNRLPDFAKVQSIDLVNGHVIVDGLRFPMPPEEVVDFRAYALAVARNCVTAMIQTALVSLLPQEAEDGKTDNVGQSEVPAAEGTVSDEPSGS